MTPTARKRDGSALHDHPIVGMTNALAPSPTPPSGQRCVTVLTLVQNFTPSMPCWLVSPNALRFHPPKVWYATGTGIGTLIPTMPTLTRAANSRAAWPLRVKIATPLPY